MRVKEAEMPGVYPSGDEPQQINAEAEEWVTIIDPQTMQPKRVRKASVNLHEVKPGVSYATPKVKPLNED